ncbi:MAG: hypothetical protein WCF79_19795 [Rhodomicrobium sp.]|jgi:mRNA interferase HicA
MEIATFRKWLAERGCHFDTPHHQRGEGHGHLTIHREGRIAELPLTGSRHQLDTETVRHVCGKLGLDASELPGPKGRV